MSRILGPKFFLSSTYFFLTIISTYGIVGFTLNYFQLAKVRDIGEWPFNLRPAFQAFLIIQSLFPVSGLFGILAGWKRQPMFLYCSGFVLIGIFTCCCVFGSVVVRVGSQDIVDDFYTSFKKYHNDSRMLDWMDDVQWQHQCCGVYGYLDWIILHSTSKRNNENKTFHVPLSCCRRDTDLPLSQCEAEMPAVSESTTLRMEKLLYKNGCGPQVSKQIRNAALRLGIEIWATGIACLFVALFLYVGVTKLYVLAGRSLAFSSKDEPGNSSEVDPSSNQGEEAQSADMNNNNSRPEKPNMSFKERDKQRRIELQKQRTQKLKGYLPSNKRQSKNQINRKLLPFAPALSHTKLYQTSPSKTGRLVSLSKSFILGEAHSHLMTAAGEGLQDVNDPNIIRKNVDMLWYQSLDKNMSTMSTTPNATSSMTVSAMFQNKKPNPNDLAAMMNDAFSQRNTVYTLVSERPFTPSVTQDCSFPLCSNLVPLPNGDVAQLGQFSPHFCSNKQQRHTHAYPFPTEEEEDYELNSEDLAEESIAAITGVVTAQHPSPTTENNSITQEDAISLVENDAELNSQLNGSSTQSTNPPPPSASSKYPTCTVRSSTLATIHEESESVKASPVNTKGASPASSYTSPENVSPRQTTVFGSDSRNEMPSTNLENTPNGQPQLENNNLTLSVTDRDDTDLRRDSHNAPNRDESLSVTTKENTAMSNAEQECYKDNHLSQLESNSKGQAPVLASQI